MVTCGQLMASVKDTYGQQFEDKFGVISAIVTNGQVICFGLGHGALQRRRKETDLYT